MLPLQFDNVGIKLSTLVIEWKRHQSLRPMHAALRAELEACAARGSAE